MNGKATRSRKSLRCAVYTRKSTDDGLEQEFNSLDAQREACEAYIRSQAGEGWTLVPTHYDDGGYSGGTMERPALKALLADVDAGKVDIIVVYKVDRLTRSLMDFARIVERLDVRNASFVSVTQAFNTTTSMGRLTLNVLLSFAQFEREVTGERIRDKIAASKAKGIWMGGNVPLGYDLGNRCLIINEVEADQVRHIYRRYLELGSVPVLVDDLRKTGHVSKKWVSRKGNKIGGKPLSCGPLYHILQNRLYLGEVTHDGKVHPGQHEAIVDQLLFDDVQAKLAKGRQQRRQSKTRAATCWLTGLLYDAENCPMSPSFGYGRGGKRYRYYVSASILPGRKQTARQDDIIRRVSAPKMEEFVLTKLKALIGDQQLEWAAAKPMLQRIEIYAGSIQIVMATDGLLEPHEEPDAVVRRLGRRLMDGDRIIFEKDKLRLVSNQRAVFRGGRVEGSAIMKSAARSVHAETEAAQMLRAAHKLLEDRNASPFTLDRHSAAQAADYQRERRIMALGLIAPDIQKQILSGKTPPGFSLDALLDRDMPLSWAEQRCEFARLGVDFR